MPITYGGGASDAVRTRLPSKTDTITSGESARDIDNRFGNLVPQQISEVKNARWAPPMFVSMAKQPKAVFVYVEHANDPQGDTLLAGPSCNFYWKGDGIWVRAIFGLSPNIDTYNFVFLGFG